MDLCSALQVDVNELLRGERVSPENYQQEAKDNLVDLVGEINVIKQEKKGRYVGAVLGIMSVTGAIAMVMAMSLGIDRLTGFVDIVTLCFLTGTTSLILAVTGCFHDYISAWKVCILHRQISEREIKSAVQTVSFVCQVTLLVGVILSATGMVARTPEPSGAGLVPLYDAKEKMARWMRYYPVEGRMPEQGNEIVVSDQYLRERGLTYREDLSIDLTFTYLDEKEYTETFTVVGVYKRALQPYHAVLVSDDFYGKACAYWEQCGLNPREEENQQAGVMFSSCGNVRRLASMLVMEAEIDLEEGEIYINDISLLSNLDFGTWAALLALVFLVMWMGYLFISNIFHLSMTGDARFFGKLSTNGITRKEIKKLIRRQNNILFLAAVVPALFVGYLFSAAVLPGILSAFMTIQVGGSGNGWIFVLAFAFSYLTVRFSERKSMKLAKNASPIEMKRYIGRFRQMKTADDGDCLKRFVVRHFQSDKIKVLKVCVSIAVERMLMVILGLLRYFSEHMGKTILFVTHNMALTNGCSRVIAVKDGKILT